MTKKRRGCFYWNAVKFFSCVGASAIQGADTLPVFTGREHGYVFTSVYSIRLDFGGGNSLLLLFRLFLPSLPLISRSLPFLLSLIKKTPSPPSP